MADRRQVKYTIKRLQQVSTWQLLVVLLICSFISATFLRLNNVGMLERRDTVLVVDEAGDDYALENALYQLQHYSMSHMNASTGPFYLQGKYSRDYQAAADRASYENPYGNISDKADEVCKAQFGSTWSMAYVQCFADELAKYPPAEDPANQVDAPSADLYRHEYASPRWSPDFAGWSVLLCILIAVIILARLLTLLVLRIMLKWRHKSI